MNNKAVGVCFCTLAAVLFLSRYIIGMLYRGFSPRVWGAQDFSESVGYVSLLPWYFAAGALIAGIVFLAQKEK